LEGGKEKVKSDGTVFFNPPHQGKARRRQLGEGKKKATASYLKRGVAQKTSFRFLP